MNIGSVSISSYRAPPPSPREDMNSKIDAAVEAGALSEVDATALEAALDNIDTALKSSSTSSGQQPLDPSEMKSRMDSLIDEQVESGTLTEEQASELQMLFAAGPGGAGGPPPPPPASDTSAASADDTLIAALTETSASSAISSSSTASTSDTVTSTTETSEETDKLELLQSFLDSLRAAEADKRGTYGPPPFGQGSSSSTGQVVNQYV